jgi:hypothetical protein
MEIQNREVKDTRSLEGRKYIHWSDNGVEEIPPNEEADIKAVAEMINAIQKATWNRTRHGFSGTHARTQGIVKGKLATEKNLPVHLKQSMFAEERDWPVLCRYSSEPGDPGLDVSSTLIPPLLCD